MPIPIRATKLDTKLLQQRYISVSFLNSMRAKSHDTKTERGLDYDEYKKNRFRTSVYSIVAKK